ncbi:M35 family metallo-endopeptidase [Limnobacter litoralis]|uniref:Lysine-specific metallo-endopeptidase domain-containing protein n=1 Tax=Limnobacter litoralis TaxID=481366 RepID=A0ABQ5YNZ4_9BURK|nr:hypothetical protein GCM10007875_01070 [Limnobacter litoralis]
MRVALHGHKTACGATLIAVTGSFEQAFKADNDKEASTQEPPHGFSDSEKKQIHEALQAQKKLLEAKLSELKRWSESDQKKFILAFGDDSELSRLKIKRRLDRMLTLNSKTGVGQFKKANNKDTPDIDPSSLYAYVHPDDVKKHSIYLGDAFWRAPLQGEDSKAGTLTHEMSHFEDIGDTADYFTSYKQGTSIYGMEASHALAKAKPELAMKHADSFEYWVEDQ